MPVQKISSTIYIIILASFLAACSSQETNSRPDGINESKQQQQTKHNAEETVNEVASASNADSKIDLVKPIANKPISTDTTNKAEKPVSTVKRKLRQLTQPLQLNEHRAKVASNMTLRKSSGQLTLHSPETIMSVAPHVLARHLPQQIERENYQQYTTNPIQLVSQHPVSTFSIDVDTGSYTNVRRLLQEGRLPQHNAVRVEEFINYFSYQYPAASNREIPFSTVTEVGPNPWNAKTHLLHIGIKGYDVSNQNLPAANLVFLLDVSGSMNNPEKLPLLKNALNLLTNQLRAQDTVAIAVYAGASGTVLQPTAGNNKTQISAALQNLSAGGSTNGAAGIRLAYQLARQSFIKEGINRVILATDGDFNVGTTNLDALRNLIKRQRKSGITLTTLGFGRGNYNDALMEQLADIGNGNYAYIDNLMAAQKSLVDEMGGTLLTIAKDVKIQIEFNPAVVQEYRLVGYENRALKREDFNNDKVDAGDIGAGHTVTAIYEISLVSGEGSRIDPLRYQSKAVTNAELASARKSDELAFVKIRYKHPESNSSKLIFQTIKLQDIKSSLQQTSPNYQFSASVAAFGQILQGSDYMQNFVYKNVIELARTAKGLDENGYRGEFINLVKLANSLSEATKISLK